MMRGSFFAIEVACEINRLSLCESELLHVFRVEKDDAAAIMDSAIAVVQAIDGRVELVVAAHGHHQKLVWSERDGRKRMNCEIGSTRRRFEYAFACGVWKIEASGFTYAAVVILETRNDARDVIAYAVVIFD